MTATDILIVLAQLLGGLTFFLFGMSTMSGGLEQMAGGALEYTLKKVTSHGLLSFFLGAGITVAIQSSSAMTVMLVGLVNSGIMSFADTFGMIMGSHVGTTVTGWILTLSGISGDNFWLLLLKPTTFAPLLAFCGIAMRMFSKRERKRNLGVILIGFAILMAGMDMMSSSMMGVRENPAFQKLLVAFTSPIVAFLVSTVFTGVIQSSAATVAIVQALALSMVNTDSPLTYQVAIPLVLGANVGTCMTALLSSIGTNKDAKRVVAMHIYTNAIGGVVCVGLMYIVMLISPDLMNRPIGIIGVAVVHSVFNIVNTIAFVPFKDAMVRFCKWTIRKGNEKTHTVFLDERLFDKPTVAISECHRLTVSMAQYANEALEIALGLLNTYDEKQSERVRELEGLTDKYEDKLGTYLVKLSNHELGDAESHAVSRLLRSIGDFERIGDHALNIRDVAQEMKDKRIAFSDAAMEELKVIGAALTEIVSLTLRSFTENDGKLASHVEPLEQVIDKLKDQMKERHVERLQHGDCTIQTGFIFSDLITNYERVSDHCSNIAAYTLQIHSEKQDTHKYLHNLRNDENGEFMHEYERYDLKYSLQ